jgi:hypothetical protein
MRVLGPGPLVRDIDWVAIETRGDVKKEKRCHKYKTRRDVVLKMHGSTVEVFERRSGKSVAKRDFEPSEECPKVPLLAADGSTHGYPSSDAIDTWLRKELKIPPPKKK